MKNLILTLLVTFASVSIGITANAGPRIVGNGGIAVEDDGKLYMLDLYERGVHKKPYYSKDITPLTEVDARMERAFDITNMENVPLDLLVYKISEAYNKKYVLGFMLENAIATIDWRLIDSTLTPTEDVRTPLNGLELKQVAVRLNNVVYINETFWNKLDNDNKVALIIHEAMYLLTKTTNARGPTGNYQYQNAADARYITGLLFTKRFEIEGPTYNNSGWNFLDFEQYLKRAYDQALWGLVIVVGEGTDTGSTGIPVEGAISGDAIKNIDARTADLAINVCRELKNKVDSSYEFAKKPYFALKVSVEARGYQLGSKLTEYSLKNADTQMLLDFQTTWYADDNAYYFGSVPTKDIVKSCVNAVKQQVQRAMLPYVYKMK